MTLEEEITELTTKWYRYVGLDHHKDRDCHWYIQKVWSYGEEPYYYAYHYGYVAGEWQSPKLGSLELAQAVLRDRLKAFISEHDLEECEHKNRISLIAGICDSCETDKDTCDDCGKYLGPGE